MQQIPNPPDNINATNSIARMIDGILFRYYWATEGLTEKEHDFSPGNGSMNMTALNLHIYDLAFITNKTFGGTPVYKKESLADFENTRQEILNLYKNLSDHLKSLDKDQLLENYNLNSKKYGKEFPFWYMLNGPIADSLTHIGQLTSWRRIAGNIQPKVNVFLGEQ